MQTLISKIGMALTAFVTLLVLGKAGYATVTAGGSLVADSPELAAIIDNVKANIWMVTTLACGLSMAACAIPLAFYDFDEKKQAEAVARVAARKAAACLDDVVVDAPVDAAPVEEVAPVEEATKEEKKED